MHQAQKSQLHEWAGCVCAALNSCSLHQPQPNRSNHCSEGWFWKKLFYTSKLSQSLDAMMFLKYDWVFLSIISALKSTQKELPPVVWRQIKENSRKRKTEGKSKCRVPLKSITAEKKPFVFWRCYLSSHLWEIKILSSKGNVNHTEKKWLKTQNNDKYFLKLNVKTENCKKVLEELF